MAIKVKTKGGTIELPKLTLRLSDMTDEVEECADNRERYGLQLAFLHEVVDGEELAGLLDGEELEEVDLTELNLLYAAVVNAYAAPIVEEQAKALDTQLKAVQPALSAVERMRAAQSRQGFRAVK